MSNVRDCIAHKNYAVLCRHRPRLRGSRGERGARTRSASSSEEEEAAAHPASSTLSSPSLPSLLSFKDVGNERGGEKEVWVSVFRYLNRAELLACMTVCKAWYKWYVTLASPCSVHAKLRAAYETTTASSPMQEL